MTKLVIDTREKRPWTFPGQEVIYKELGVGDYTYEGYEQEFAVERKSLDDLATSMGSERTRFENEIRRANGYANVNDAGNPLPGTKPDKPLREFVVIIEAPRSSVADFVNQKRCPNYFSRIYPKSIISTTKSWPDKYENLSFLWENDREQAKQECLRLLDKWYLEYS